MEPAPKPAATNALASLLLLVTQLAVISYGVVKAYTIRLSAIEEFGPLIHEFDPWFNYRATEYLHANGREKFFRWFDTMSWYPLGRPVGTTIYPGIQFTAVAIYHALQYLGMPMSLNDVCCYVPAWFGVSASILTGLTAWETSGSATAGAFATAVMAVIPAHIMRSIGGGFDNEAIANTAMALTFYLWVRALRTNSSWWISVLAGVAYYYMVAAWGGYVFVLNMVAVHTIVLLLLGRYSPKLHKAYTIFYVIGTLGAISVPVVGLTPLKSMEQLMPLGLLFGLQFMYFCEAHIKKSGMAAEDARSYRLRQLGIAAAVFFAIFVLLTPTGILGPVSMRVRSLFVPHTRTGNPLVDSVAEHQATSPDAYWHNLHYCCVLAPIGLGIIALKSHKSDASIFLIIYAVIAYYFASKMNRLIILLGPVASILAGVAVGWVLEWCLNTTVDVLFPSAKLEDKSAAPAVMSEKKGKESKKGKSKHAAAGSGGLRDALSRIVQPLFDAVPKEHYPIVRMAAVAVLVFTVPYTTSSFLRWSEQYAYQMSMGQPSVISNAQLHNGDKVVIRDYLDSYEWMAKETAQDARMLAWWDYGYQITGIGNRTSLADGNTWNQAHIALIGKMLTLPEDKAHELIRHMADYVYVWAGGGHDDMSKSSHLARIANSNFPGHCGRDKTCDTFSFHDQEMKNPMPMMANSLLYKMCMKDLSPTVRLDPSLFKEVYTSKYGKVRIYKVMNVDMASRKWLADPANKLCDPAPGDWYCPGQYPPAIWKSLPAHFLKNHRLNTTAVASE